MLYPYMTLPDETEIVHSEMHEDGRVLVHIAKGSPVANATKVWITESRKCLLCNNNSRIPEHTLRNIIRMIEARSDNIIKMWLDYFGKIEYYC
jgi:hypothetical protein